MVAVLIAEGAAKTYSTGVQRVEALKPTDLAIGANSFTLITGPSGSGKSTLLALLSGLARPSAGRIEALGSEIHALAPRTLDAFRLANFGFIFQGFHLIPALTAVEQVSIVLERQGKGRAAARDKAIAVLDDLGLSHRRNSRPAELSGGEKQRVAVARALAKDPQIIFADEPTSALDSENGRQVIACLRKAMTDHGTTVVCVTHDLRLIEQASRVLRLEDGALREPAAELLARA